MKSLRVTKLTIILFLLFFDLAHALATGKLTVRVIDEDNAPIEGADVIISYSKPNPSGTGVADILINGVSDGDGLFTAQSGTMNYLGVSAKKVGYYYTDVNYEFTSRSKLLNRWEPWNPTVEVVLKKKRNPVPMYMKGTGWVEVPSKDELVWYDLEKGDWVAPYGSGVTKDFGFMFTSDIREFRRYDLKLILVFANELDGIQEYIFDTKVQSSFKWPFEAPVYNYQRELIKKIHKVPGKTESNINRQAKYIYRVRTQTDSKGNIISAKYGKMASEFDMSPDGSKFLINFSYYFNPDGTRNLEEDPKKNLFKQR